MDYKITDWNKQCSTCVTLYLLSSSFHPQLPLKKTVCTPHLKYAWGAYLLCLYIPVSVWEKEYAWFLCTWIVYTSGPWCCCQGFLSPVPNSTDLSLGRGAQSTGCLFLFPGLDSLYCTLPLWLLSKGQLGTWQICNVFIFPLMSVVMDHSKFLLRVVCTRKCTQCTLSYSLACFSFVCLFFLNISLNSWYSSFTILIIYCRNWQIIKRSIMESHNEEHAPFTEHDCL